MIESRQALGANELESQYRAVQDYAGWRELDNGVLGVTGRDRAHWLHKLITADVEHLNAGQGVHGALLDVKGHFVAELVVLVQAESILLLVDPAVQEILLNTLRRYIFREKVQVNDESRAWALFTVVGKESDGVLPQRAPETLCYFTAAEFDGDAALFIRSLRATVPSTDVLAPASARERLHTAFHLIPNLSAETLDVLRVEAGQPRWGIDFDTTTLAMEIPDVLSVRVDQGCYVGQEVVARIVHRGHVNRHLVGLKVDGNELPARATPILHESQVVGTITSAALSPRLGTIALGYVRREVSNPGTLLQIGDNRHVQVVTLPLSE